MRADCLKMKMLQLNNIRSGGQERSFKSRTCHSQGRYVQAEETYGITSKFFIES